MRGRLHRVRYHEIVSMYDCRAEHFGQLLSQRGLAGRAGSVDRDRQAFPAAKSAVYSEYGVQIRQPVSRYHPICRTVRFPVRFRMGRQPVFIKHRSELPPVERLSVFRAQLFADFQHIFSRKVPASPRRQHKTRNCVRSEPFRLRASQVEPAPAGTELFTQVF